MACVIHHSHSHAILNLYQGDGVHTVWAQSASTLEDCILSLYLFRPQEAMGLFEGYGEKVLLCHF